MVVAQTARDIMPLEKPIQSLPLQIDLRKRTGTKASLLPQRDRSGLSGHKTNQMDGDAIDGDSILSKQDSVDASGAP